MTLIPGGNSVANWISVHLRDSGNSIEANVDGSTTPVEFDFTAPKRCAITRMLVIVQDDGQFLGNGYGAAAALSNGILFEYVPVSGSNIDLLDQGPITTNIQWAEQCFDSEIKVFGGGGPRSLVARWSFALSGVPLYLNTGDALRITIRDDCTVLTEHRFLLQGRYL